MRTVLIQDRPVELGLEALRERLRRLPRESLAVGGDPGTGRQDEGRPASVLVPIVVREDELTVILTRRTPHLRAHSGQISFPGGRSEPGDPDPEATALRETHEEIGLAPGHVEVLGRLSVYSTRTGFRITPVVGFVHPPFELELDRNEVDVAFEVPLRFFLDPQNHQRHSRQFEGVTRWFYAMPYGEHYIWGATAAMLVNLYRHVADAAG